MATEKPKILVLGGCGFIGRHIVSEFVSKDVASSICVVDKVPPQIAWLNEQQTKIFEDDVVTFRSANLINPASCAAAFGEEEWDWVINAAGEAKTGQVEAVYREGIVRLSTNCANEAAKRKVKIYVEISAGSMASNEKVPHKESADCNPWTVTSKCKYQVEKEIKSLPDLNWIIVRPATVYGLSDKTGLTPRLVFGAVYRHLGETMKMLWDEKLCINTVHVTDVARAISWLCQRGKTGQIYNVVDDANTKQGDIGSIVCDIYKINHDYWGNTLSTVAKTDAAGLVNEINEKHLIPWAGLCSAGGLDNTPLTPYIDQDSVHHNHLNLDGSKLRAEGFTYSVPRPTRENLLQVLKDFVVMKIFPGSALPSQ
ncbi:uncharacterized protein LOC121858644 [Homarus americanus]|uniref:dTDP-D-glucose 4,6-dehydratase-like n=1 Tax=Homarus americanus TaxID=6706 RepID=A0A8J5TLW3_HOMAM|nr:uncharacterized protein LOC121858644 [Homarus americanus]KAG7174992.1 dTDP-D-glucose 4,6-dehydratase-like [Homarus americanus]